MKIIQRCPFIDWIHEFECSKCKTKLQANYKDIRQYTIDGGYYVECLFCKKHEKVFPPKELV